MSILDSLETEDRKQILSACAASTKVACKVFYPGRFRLPFSPSHDEVFKLLDDDSQQLCAIASWRGFGKTSIVQLGYPTKRCLFQDSRFVITASATYRQSVMQSENLKRQLAHNRVIRSLGFTNTKSDVWSKDQWMANTIDGHGCMFLPVSYNQEVRGMLFRDGRPDLYIVDDYEDSESVMSEEQRHKKKTRFYSDLMGSIDRASKNWRIIVIGTILHQDSLLANLIDDPNWHTLRLELCDDEYVSNWPEQQTNEEIWEMAERYRAQGLMDVFYREYRNICMSPENAPFKRENFRYYDSSQLKGRFLEYVVLVDPAKTVSETACDTAIVGLGIDILNGEIFIVDMKCSRLHVHEQIDAGLSMCKSIGARVLGVETAGSGEYIEWSWMNTIRERGLNIEFVGLKATAGPSQYVPHGSTQHGKDARISQALVPLYNGKKIYHPKGHPLLSKLEDQLVTYPYSKRKDLIDALSYVGGMMHKGERYFANKDIFQMPSRLPGNLDPRAEARALKALCGGDIYYDDASWMV